MPKKTVAVVGASGMLGSMVLDVLSRESDLNIIGTVRAKEHGEALAKKISGVTWRLLDAQHDGVATIAKSLQGAEWIINAIGITKPLIKDDNPAEIERAIAVNSLFPQFLARAAGKAQILQIATDCVYSGAKGRYTENDKHDALDVYGKTKSLGEGYQPNMHCLRCSIIGPEPKDFKFLIEWFVRQPKDATVKGFTNHEWNGVTTLQFAKLCLGVIKHDLPLGRMQHVVPGDAVTKFELLKIFAKEYKRGDIKIQPSEAKDIINRTLATTQEQANRELWLKAGYPAPPTIAQMLAETAAFDYRPA